MNLTAVAAVDGDRIVLSIRDFRLRNGRDDAVHMILVASKAVLPRHLFVMTRLAQILFHVAKVGREISGITLFVTFQIVACVISVVVGRLRLGIYRSAR